MIRQLVQRDPAFRLIPVFAVFYAVLWWFAASTIVAGSFAGGMLMVMVVPGMCQRYTLLEAALPIAGKQLFLSKVAVRLAFLWAPILAAIAAPLIVRGNQVWTQSLPIFECGAVVTVGFMLVQCVRVERMNPPRWLAIPVLGAGFTWLPFMLMRGVFPGSDFVAAAVLGGGVLVSAALFLNAWAEVPTSYQLSPIEVQGGEPVLVRTERAGAANGAAPWWPVFRELYIGSWRNRFWPFLLLLVVFQSLMFGWVFAALAVIYIPLSFAGYRTGLRWLIHLPISARKLFWMAWFPTTAAIVLGLAANAAVIAFASSSTPAVTLVRPQGRGPARLNPQIWSVQVPPGYWLWTGGGAAPLIEAPWGESHRPVQAAQIERRIGPGESVAIQEASETEASGSRDFKFYNPYSVGLENSRRFVEWQFLRATQAVYGQPVPISRIAALPRMRTILRQPRAQIVIAAIVLLYLLVQMCALHLFGWRRLQHTHVAFRVFLFAAPILIVYLLLLLPFPAAKGGNFPMEALVVYLVRALPSNLGMLALMAAASVAGLYWIAEKLWREQEFRSGEALARAREYVEASREIA